MSYAENIDIKKPLDLFGNLSVVNRSTIIELKSIYGFSNLRDVKVEVNTGTVVSNTGDSEYTLSTGITTGSSATLDSAERGRYVPGTKGEIGIGVRHKSQTFTGTAYAEWGYFDDNDGFGFGIDATDIYTFIKRNGSKTKTYQSNWNGDKLDGTGASGVTLDLVDGNIFQIDYAWYGYGDIIYSLQIPSNGKQEKIEVHRINPDNQTSVKNPNLPIRAIVSNGDTTTDYDIFVAGRQYAMFTPYKPNNRVNAQYRLSMGSIDTTLLPVISFRKKTAFKSVSVKLEGIDIITDADLLYQVRLNPSLTGASYATPTNTTASETACEIDVTASAVSNGELLYEGLVDATGTGQTATGSASADLLGYAIPEEQPITLCVRRISGTGATVSAVLRWREEW